MTKTKSAVKSCGDPVCVLQTFHGRMLYDYALGMFCSGAHSSQSLSAPPAAPCFPILCSSVCRVLTHC